jgi:hypothetical protein
MGKAQIMASLGEGLYQARITYNTTLPAVRKAALEACKPALEQQLAAATTARQTAETDVVAAQAELNLLIEQLAAATPEEAPAIRDAIVEKQAAAKIPGEILGAARRKESSLTLALVQVDMEIVRLDAVLATEDTRNIWCADYSNTLTGQVDTIEINGEPGQILIAPGGSGEASALLTGAEAMSTANWARNFALHPYWQKWKPTYRTGLILSISGDTCTVSLDPAESSYQALDINQQAILGGVPIQYLECNGLAFEVGDGVVVRFTGQNWSSPVVVGFAHNPEVCCPDILSIQYTTFNMFLGEAQELSLAEDTSHSCPVYWSIFQYPQPADWANPTPAELIAAATGDGTRGTLTNLDGSPLNASTPVVLYTAPSAWISCDASQATVQAHGFGQTDEMTMHVSDAVNATGAVQWSIGAGFTAQYGFGSLGGPPCPGYTCYVYGNIYNHRIYCSSGEQWEQYSPGGGAAFYLPGYCASQCILGTSVDPSTPGIPSSAWQSFPGALQMNPPNDPMDPPSVTCCMVPE